MRYAFWFSASVIMYGVLLLCLKGRVSHASWKNVLADGIGVILVSSLGCLFMFFYGRRVEAWKKRLRRRFKGTVWGIDVGAWLKIKKD